MDYISILSAVFIITMFIIIGCLCYPWKNRIDNDEEGEGEKQYPSTLREEAERQFTPADEVL
jgi:hypothetical protein